MKTVPKTVFSVFSGSISRSPEPGASIFCKEERKEKFMVTIKDIINSPLLLALVCGGLLYITAFSVVYLLKARKRALELGITSQEIADVIKSSLIFSIVPSLSIVIGLVALAASLGTIWAWWRLSVIGSLSFETQIASSLAPTLGFATTTELMEKASGEQFGVVMILMSVVVTTIITTFAAFFSAHFSISSSILALL
mgnify:CR=1 FL=1